MTRGARVSRASDAIAAAASHAKLRYLNVDLGHAEDKATLFHELARIEASRAFRQQLRCARRSLEDRDWIGKTGCLIRLGHATHYRKTHPNDWSTLEGILSEACTFWRERNLAFWVLVN
jgi:hypothetical protein